MRKSTAILVILFLIAGVTGCSMTVFNTGRDFDNSQIAKIEKGKTTAWPGTAIRASSTGKVGPST